MGYNMLSMSSKLERDIVVRRGRGKPDAPDVYFDENEAIAREVKGMLTLGGDSRIKYNKDDGILYFLSYPPLTETEISQQPKGVKAAKRRWTKHETLEEGLQAAAKVRDLHEKDTGDVALRTRRVIRLVSRISKSISTDLSSEEKRILREQAAALLVEAKFANAVKEEKKKIRDFVMASTDEEDSLGRPNEPRAHMYLGHTRNELKEQREFEEDTHDKNETIFEILFRERERYRLTFKQGIEEAKRVAALVRTGGIPRPEFKKSRNVLMEYFRKDFSRETIRLKPYSDAAVIAWFEIVGSPASKVDMAILEGFLGEGAARYKHIKPFNDLTHSGVKSILEGIVSRLETVLNEGDIALLPEEEKPTPFGLYGPKI